MKLLFTFFLLFFLNKGITQITYHSKRNVEYIWSVKELKFNVVDELIEDITLTFVQGMKILSILGETEDFFTMKFVVETADYKSYDSYDDQGQNCAVIIDYLHNEIKLHFEVENKRKFLITFNILEKLNK